MGGARLLADGSHDYDPADETTTTNSAPPPDGGSGSGGHDSGSGDNYGPWVTGFGNPTKDTPGYVPGRDDPSQAPDALIKQQYQTSLGRAPTDKELASDEASLTKYGWDTGPYGGVQATIASRANNVAGSGVAGDPNGPQGANVSSGTGKLNTPSFSGNPANTSPQFTDPTQQLLESYALNRYNQLQNPDPNSGTGLYESYAKQLVDQLKADPYTQGQEAAIKAGAYNAINTDEQTTTQQWMEEMSKRGIQPSSGVALQGLQNIKEQFNKARASVDQQFAVNGINMSQNNRTQALSVLGNLATSENTRLNSAEHYATIPYNLTQDAFGRNVAAVQAGGSPGQNMSMAIQLMTAVQNSQSLSSAQKAQYAEQLMEFIAGL